MKKTILDFKQAKTENKKTVMLTAYDYASAKLVDSCGIDGILVGDSLGMVCLGYKDTLSVTMEDMIHHIKAVSRGNKNSLLVGDMPFMSYHTSTSDAVRNAGRLVQEAHAEAVKIEGGASIVPEIHAIVRAQIPVMGHIGLTPQSVNVFGGFKVQGNRLDSAQKLVDDAKRLEDAGVFAIVLECIPGPLAKHITKAVSVPTIGIGAGSDCDGQILVYHDILGLLSDIKPKFVKVFANAGEVIEQGVKKYAEEVRSGQFPGPEHRFNIKTEIIDRLQAGVDDEDN